MGDTITYGGWHATLAKYYDNIYTYVKFPISLLTHWGRVTHICVGNPTIIGSDNGLSPGRRQAITWTDVGILLIGPIGTNFSEMLIEIHIFSLKKIHLKMSSGKWRPFCLGLNGLTNYRTEKRTRTENGVVKINFSRMRLSLAKPCYSDDELLRFHWYWGGGTKAPFVNFSVSKIFDHAKVPVKFVESHSYLTGVTAAELRRHLTIINVIFNN